MQETVLNFNMAACVPYPQPAVQDGENNSVQDEN